MGRVRHFGKLHYTCNLKQCAFQKGISETQLFVKAQPFCQIKPIMEIIMPDSKLGCALQPNNSFLIPFFVKLSQTSGLWGNFGRVEHYFYIVHYLKKTMFLLLPVFFTHLTNVGSFLSWAGSKFVSQLSQGDDMTRQAGISVLQPCMRSQPTYGNRVFRQYTCSTV